jgi:hypothetical protein
MFIVRKCLFCLLGLAFLVQHWVAHMFGALVRHIMMEHTAEQTAHFMSQEEKRNMKELGSHNLLLWHTQHTELFSFYYFLALLVWTQGLIILRPQCTEDFPQVPFSRTTEVLPKSTTIGTKPLTHRPLGSTYWKQSTIHHSWRL